MYNISTVFTHAVVLDLLNDGSIVIDVGACEGKFVNELRKHFKCNFYLIEPNVKNYSNLVENYKDCKIFNCALYSKNISNMMFYDITGKPEWGNITGIHKSGNNYKVSCIGINSIFKVLEIENNVDLLKMDIEGSEYDVILKMTQKTANRIKQITLENHYINRTQELYDKLKKLGYEIIGDKKGEILAVRN